MSGAVPERQTPDLGLSTNPTPVDLKPCDVTVKIAREALRSPVFRTADDNLGRAVTSAEYRKNNSEVARWLLRLVASAPTRPPASAAPVDELVERTVQRLWAYSVPNSGSQDGQEFLDEVADQLTIYARRVAELEAEVERLQQAPTEADPSYAAMRAALTREQG